MADGVALRINQVQYTAQQERLMAALALMPDQASGLAVREGRRLGPGLECSISGDGLSVVVQPGVCVVNHALASGGDYHVAIPAAVTRTLGAKPGAGQKRRDTVVVDVADADVTQKPTALREANIALLPGAATSGTPVAPAAGAMQFEIGQVAFDGANTPTIQPTNPRYTWAVGGIGVVFSQAERDALTVYNGLKVYRADLARFQERVAGAWRDEGSADTGWLTGSGYFTMATGWSDQGTRLRKVDSKVRLEITVERTGTQTLDANFFNTDVLTIVNSAYLPGPNANSPDDQQIVIGNNAQGAQVSFALRSFTGVLQVWATSPTLPINTGHRLRAMFEYYTD